jgi:protein-tyrosine phosphatase
MRKIRLALPYFVAVGRSWCVAAAFTIATLLSAVGPSAWAPECDETRAGGYTFEKLRGTAGEPVRIYVCPEVDCASKKEFGIVTSDSWSAPAPAGLARPYFLVERSENGTREVRIMGARRLALEGAFNFRDLGGMRTADGKTVRWGQVFRSDTLTHLTAHDYERLNSIGISLVCDLRSRQERVEDPTEWREASPVFVLAPVSENAKGAAVDGTLLSKLQTSKISAEEGKAIFEGFYIRMVFDSAAKFGSVLRAIETTDRPSMFHCTGGRDRTGITAALLLHILGVPNETIVEDFVLSTQYLNERPATSAIGAPSAIPAEVLRLQPRYIEAVFKAIDQQYGSFDRYRREALHFSDADVSALRSRLLE